MFDVHSKHTPGESKASRRTAMGFRAAAGYLYGEAGIAMIRSILPADAAAAFFDPAFVGEQWIDERHLIAFMHAVLDGPCGKNRVRFHEWSRTQIMGGFGRAKAAMLRIVTPSVLASRAAALWREEHTHGQMLATVVSSSEALVTLVDHAYAHHAIAHGVLTESLRGVINLSYHARDVRGSFKRIDERSLQMRFEWR